jgi:hypothetical protein
MAGVGHDHRVGRMAPDEARVPTSDPSCWWLLPTANITGQPPAPEQEHEDDRRGLELKKAVDWFTS